MNNKLIGAGVAALGALLAIIGLLLMLVIVPSMKVFPDDVNTTRKFDLEYLTILDEETLELNTYRAEDGDQLRIARNVNVLDVSGDATLICETQVIYDSSVEGAESYTVTDTDDGTCPQIEWPGTVRAQVKLHALDRSTLTPVEDFPDEWRENPAFASSYWERQGQVIGWGIGITDRDYDGWSDDTRDLVTLEYQERMTHEGISVYYFTSEDGPDPIDPLQAEFLGLPTSLTLGLTGELAQLASGIDVEGVELGLRAQAKLINTIGQATEEITGSDAAVPIEYSYDYVGEYWAEPTTGVLIDTTKYENRTATIPLEIRNRVEEILSAQDDPESDAFTDPDDPAYLPPDILDTLLPFTVNQFYYESSDESVQDAIDDATGTRDQIVLLGSTVPTILIVLGIVLGGAGGFVFSRKQGGSATE